MINKDKAQRAIGIFDSGIGGLTVANAINSSLPNEQIIYFGDTAHLPYGEKSADAIRYYCLKISKYLLEQNCKMIVIACNSASSAAYDTLLEFFEGRVLFVNVVDPLVDLVIKKGFKKIGVIATKATTNSHIYKNKLKHFNQKIQVQELATPLLVPMIEEGFYKGAISQSIIKNYLEHDDLKDIDALLLACTHYPLIKNEIEMFYKGTVSVLDSTDVVSSLVKELLTRENLLSNKRTQDHRFYVSDFTDSFEETAQNFYGKELHLEVQSIW